ncbi:LppU/SCO3897 family protein [Streptomyces sp. NPDC002577]
MTTPPPQGQNPFAQGQQPYGQPQGGNPYAQQAAPQPGQPGVPPQPSPYFGAPAPAPQQPRRNIKQYFRIAGFIVAALVVAGGWWASRDDANTAAVGSCMHRGSTDDNNPDLEVVDCGDAKAEYKVLAKIDGSFTSLTADKKCAAEASDFQYAYTETGDSGSFLLCLKDK